MRHRRIAIVGISVLAALLAVARRATAAEEASRLTASPVVPGYVPFALLLALETAAVIAWILVLALPRPDVAGGLVVCARCTQLHKRTELFGRGADAIAVGALAFLVALPFVSAADESGITLLQAALAASAVIAVLASAAEADYLVRALAARLLPHFTWNADPARIVGGGARWLGLALALYLFQPGPGIVALFGGVGKRLAIDLPSTWTIWAAATILVLASIVSLLTRWLVPLVSGSLPVTFAARGRARGRPT